MTLLPKIKTVLQLLKERRTAAGALSICLMMGLLIAAGTDAPAITADPARLQNKAPVAVGCLDALSKEAAVTIPGRTQNWYVLSLESMIETEEVYSLQREVVSYAPSPMDAALAEAMEEEKQEPIILLPEPEPVIRLPQISAGAAITEPSEATELQQQVADAVRSYIGAPYRYGGASPSGFDCSGLTMYVYEQFGITLPHGASSQTRYGLSVANSALQLGDLVFFRDPAITSGAASHVGIYVGGGQFVHAASSRVGSVILSSLGETYWNTHYAGARRLIDG